MRLILSIHIPMLMQQRCLAPLRNSICEQTDFIALKKIHGLLANLLFRGEVQIWVRLDLLQWHH